MWDLMRQDDNGNKVRVASHGTRISALAQLMTFESGAQHKQTYWLDGPEGPVLTTNRDLYLHVLKIGRDARAASWSLSAFLRTLWKTSTALRGRETVELDEVAALFAAAGSNPPPPYDPGWTTKDLTISGDAPSSYEDWENVLLSQIADLEDFLTDPRGARQDEIVLAPRPEGTGARSTPRRWRNFDPASYVECAVAGSLGGWKVEDGGRVPEEGSTLKESPVREVGEFDWVELSRLIVCGQLFA